MLNTLFVVETDWLAQHSQLNAIDFDSYLRDFPKRNEPKTRVINLCDTSRYLSEGYYCSLLAEARHHQVIPSVKVINDLRGGAASLWYEFPKSSAALPDALFEQAQVVCMGQSAQPQLSKLAEKVFKQFPAPILLLNLSHEVSGIRAQLKRCAMSELNAEQQQFCLTVLESYASKNFRPRSRNKKYRWDMAMLVNANEANPPSNKGALNRFCKAGEKLGIKVDIVSAGDIQAISHYDALFIRETTAIDHHTYQLARDAEEQGLVVIDDSDSILRCCNKVYLHDAFNYKNVPSLRTHFIQDLSPTTLDLLVEELGFPMIIKMPEGSFSSGVFKVSSRDELVNVVGDLLTKSAVVLAQEYLYTDYDWRIGVLNGRALYACRYYMARNHWQIYNHKSKHNFSGSFDALPTFEVPGYVLKAALGAAKVVGSGLYGIDIKVSGGHAYVLEVNDNPSIEHGVEDKYLGEELYMQIMAEFLRRLETRGR
jgi:glutathione synthase/RimK-type ligase-like ATP-grasp enzyme